MLEARLTSDTPILARPTRDILDSIWRASSGEAAAALLILLLALTLALAAVFPQLPAGLAGAAQEHWLAETAGAYATAGPALLSLGAFNLLDGPWFRLLLALAVYHVLLRLAGQAHVTWSALHGRAVQPPPAPDLPGRPFTVDGPLETALAALAGTLQRRYPVRATTVAGARGRIYLQRGRLAGLGLLLVYVGALSVLLGLLLDDAAGWRSTGLTLTPGGSVEAGRGNSLQINLLQIVDRGSRAASALAVARADGARSGYASYTRPFNWGNVWVAQRAIGPALAVTAHDRQGRPVLLERGAEGKRSGDAINLPFPPGEAEQAFADPARNIALRVVSYPALPDRGFRGSVFLVEAYRGDNPAEPILTSFVENEADVQVGDVRYTLRRGQYAVLEAAYVPGLVLLAPGGLALLAGIALALWRRTARAWLDLVEQDGAVQVEARAADAELEPLLRAVLEGKQSGAA